MAKFPFSDLHSFKDFVVYAQSYLPDEFPAREGLGPDDQWTMDLAFQGLREGLALTVAERGPKPLFAKCQQLVDKAHDEYRAGQWRDGFATLEEVNKLLRKVPTH